jgi:hypothetical protein
VRRRPASADFFSDPAEYRLLTVWRFAAPIDSIYAAVCDPLRWPQWWPDARRIEELQPGAADGVGQRLHCVWQGRLPYALSFELLTTRMQPRVAVEGSVSGELEGMGRCVFAQEGAVAIVRHEWRVRTTPRWMNLISPVAHALFKRNHAQAMRRGGEGLARHLGVRLLGVEHGDLAE